MAVFQLNKEKAPSPDGFTIPVYQECWDVIKEDLMRVFIEFHTNGVINQSTNATFITMVPKKSHIFYTIRKGELNSKPLFLSWGKNEGVAGLQ